MARLFYRKKIISGMIASTKRVLTISLLILSGACAAGKIDAHLYRVGVLENEAIDEASGLAASRRHPDILWTLNDSGDQPVLYALSTTGAYVGKIRIEDAENRDWEDLAGFTDGEKTYLAVADIGDNAARRDFCTVYVIEEPEMTGKKMLKRSAVKPAWRIDFQYEDGPRDCESIAVDIANQRILLLSKRSTPPVLYSLPLFARSGRSISVARKLAAVSNLNRAGYAGNQSFGLLQSHPYRYQPTGMDISPDNTWLAVLTYRFVYLYIRPDGQRWETALSGVPKILPLPRLEQAESICFSADGRDLFVTSEKRPAPLLKISLASF